MLQEEIFRTFDRDHRCLSEHLDGRLTGLEKEIRALEDELSRPDAELLGDIRARYAPEPPLLGEAMRRGPHQRYRMTTEVEQIELVLPITSGDPSLFDWWPDGVAGIEGLAMERSEPPHVYEPLPPVWRRVEAGLLLRVQVPTAELHERTEEIARLLGEEERRARSICEAYPASIDRWVTEVERRASELLALRRKRWVAVRQLDELLVHLPPYEPPSLTVEVVEDEPDQGQTSPDRLIVRLPRKVVVAEDEWCTFVGVVQRWGDALRQHARAVTPPIDEYVLRDLLLATLRAVYPVAEGEVMHAGRKTDIYVLVDPAENETKPIIAELKFWRGPRAVHGDLDQHLDQLTLRESRGLILFFIRNRGLDRTLGDLRREVSSHPGFVGWSPDDDIGSWPAARFRSTIDPTARVMLTIGVVHVPGGRRGGVAKRSRR